jgi:hypothetical protein
MRFTRIFFVVSILALVVVGCARQSEVSGPENANLNNTSRADKDGTETLGTPSIAIATGSGFAEGGVGMVGTDTGVINLTVPAGATIMQVLLYWAGGTTAGAGDDQISLNGTMIQGTLIGGPTYFYTNVDAYFFSAYRADITGLGLVAAGANSLTVADFDFTGTTVDENDGASILVIYDDGTSAEIAMRDGLDMAYFDFAPTLDATVPQTFPVQAEASDRVADLVIFSGSVGLGRANQIKVTTIAGDQLFNNPLASTDGMWWDSLLLPVNVPAGATELTVQLISTPGFDPQGASMGWVGAGLSVPVTALPAALGDRVWIDTNVNGIQDGGEVGLEGVTVHLRDCTGATLATTVTDVNGLYLFSNLQPGDYMVHFVQPAGYEFTLLDVGSDDTDSDAAADGSAICTTLVAGETDLTWDAGVYMPVIEEAGCRMTGGGNSSFVSTGFGTENYTFGGQAGASLASQPQPWGEWTHHQQNGESGSFVFHAGTASAPEATEIDWITCTDPGWCVQARPAPAKQLDFGGVGTFKNMRNVPASIASHVEVGESLHWFEVNVDDLGEPGGHENPGGCDPLGYGRNGGAELADCDCPDFYRIRIYEGLTDATPVMYEVYGYIEGGDLQIHPLTGRDDGNP